MARAIGVTAQISYKADESGEEYTVIPKCTVLATPKVTITKIDTTHLGISDNVMTSVPGMGDPQPLEFSFEFDAEVYEALNDVKNSLEVIDWRIESPSGHGATWEFQAYITDLDEPFEANVRNVTKVSLQITGAVDYSVEA